MEAMIPSVAGNLCGEGLLLGTGRNTTTCGQADCRLGIGAVEAPNMWTS